jgi:hypothetical protein
MIRFAEKVRFVHDRTMKGGPEHLFASPQTVLRPLRRKAVTQRQSCYPEAEAKSA